MHESDCADDDSWDLCFTPHSSFPFLLSLVTYGGSGRRTTPVTTPQTSEINLKGAAWLSSHAPVAGDGLPVPSDGVSTHGHHSDIVRQCWTTMFTHGVRIGGNSPLRQVHTVCSCTDTSRRAAVCNAVTSTSRARCCFTTTQRCSARHRCRQLPRWQQHGVHQDTSRSTHLHTLVHTLTHTQSPTSTLVHTSPPHRHTPL